MKGKRGLGEFLLRGLKRSSGPSKKKRARKASVSHSADFKFFSDGRIQIEETRELARVEAPEPIQTVREVVIEPPAQTGENLDTLTTRDLIRPSERIQLAIEGFLLDQRSPHTQRAYGKDLKRFIKFLILRESERGTEPLKRNVIIAYKDSLLGEGLEHTSIDRHLATLRTFFKWFVHEGLLERSPAEGVKFMKPKRISKTQGFTDLEVRRILDLPNLHTRTGAMHYAIFSMLFFCGLRRSELCSLRTTQIIEERGHRIIRLRGKGNAERMIVLVPRVWHAIQHYCVIARKSLRTDQYLFSPVRNNRTGTLDKALDPSMIFYIVTKYAKQAGVQNRVSPHSCRATAISNARDHHVPDRAIQEFAGWASPDMITRYDKRRTSIEKSAAHAIHYGNEARSIPTASVESTPASPDPKRVG